MMEFFKNLALVPASYLITVFVVIGVILGLIYLIQKVSGRAGQNLPPKTTPKWIRAIRLAVFGIFSLVLMVVVLMIFSSVTSSTEEIEPAPGSVTIPDDLPFTVKEIHFESEDGTRLAGWYVPPENQAVIILLHGYGGTRLDMRWHAEKLVAAGYGVLMYDERASGESGGTRRSFGWEDAPDVGAAITFLQSQPEAGPAQIGIAGCSIGGQIALQGAAYYPEIGAVWADGASTIRAKDIQRADNLLIWLIRTTNFILDWVYQLRLEMKAPPAMIDIIGTIAPRPIMLVGGGVKAPVTGNEASQMVRYAGFAGDNAEVWIIDEAFHCDGPHRIPDEYAARMIGFFDQALGK